MKCPKCQASFTPAPDASGIFACPGCGSRLRSRPAGSATPGPPPAPPQPAAGAAATAAREAPAPSVPPATAPPPPAASAVGLDAVLSEIRAVRRTQDEILSLLRAARPAAAPAVARPVAQAVPDTDADEDLLSASDVVAPRPTLVLLVDDDEQTRAAAQAAIEAVGIEVRHADDGNTAVSAIAADKPDAVVLEPELGGPMPGKDLINMIKATMEWVDIPVILYTRTPVASDEEARTKHGADGYVVKGAGSAELLTARLREILSRG